MYPIDKPGEFRGSSLLITGGTGSFGKAFSAFALDQLELDRLIIFSRDELKQLELRQRLGKDPRLRFFIGDVRDEQRLRRAMDGVDMVLHAAALKQVDTAEYNPFECIQTNVLGAQNVINAAIETGVKKVIGLSTDKASSPVNLYGASKLCSDKLFIAGNHYAAHGDTKLSVVRYGNVFGSRGSFVLLLRSMEGSHKIPVTDPRMTRFWITLSQAVDLVLFAFTDMMGGELYVPKIPSMKIVDLIKAIAPEAELEIIGIRPGEKLHEEMISMDDARRTREFEHHYVINPVVAEWASGMPERGVPVPEGFSYTSDRNEEWLTADDLKSMVEELEPR